MSEFPSSNGSGRAAKTEVESHIELQVGEPASSSALQSWLGNNLLYLAWVQATVATLGSLYFSEIMDLPPCVLCWYQRILMYPLALILAVGILRRDTGIHLYVIPLVVIGLAISTYHNLLYFGVIEESLQACMLGVSCTARQIEWLGFITIPLMAFTAFSVILISMLAHMFLKRGDSNEW